MASARSLRAEAIVQHCRETEEDSDSDVELVSYDTGTQLQFNPLGATVAQFLCKRLEVKREGMPVTAARVLGAPCKTVDTLGDGNCFFRAISEAVCGTDRYHGTIRHAVVKQLESHAAAYDGLLRTGYKTVSEHLSKHKMRSPGSWATEVEIQAAADVLGVSVYTYYINHWVEYSCQGVQVSDQGIYLENLGDHFKTVVCVKRPETQTCYGYCKADTRGDSVTRESSSLPLESADRVSVTDPAAEEDYWIDDECLAAEQDRESDDECLAAEEDYRIDDECLAAEEDGGQSQRTQVDLSWSVLNTTWGSFLCWLCNRWWGQVSEDEISDFMDRPKRRTGDIVVAAPFGDTPGAVCSITLKTKNSTLTTDLVIRGGFYTCPKLVKGDFSDPIKVMKYLRDNMDYTHVQPKPKTMPSETQCFSAARVAEELSFMMEVLSRAFWGTYESAESSLLYREMIRHLHKMRGKFTNPCAIVHCTEDDSLGYLFEIVTDQERKIKVTFDRFGFTIGNGSHFYEITSLLYYISSVEPVTFLAVPRSWNAVKSPTLQTMETGETMDSHG